MYIVLGYKVQHMYIGTMYYRYVQGTRYIAEKWELRQVGGGEARAARSRGERERKVRTNRAFVYLYYVYVYGAFPRTTDHDVAPGT